MSIKDRCEPYMIWRIGDGYISFWWENWTGKGALAKLLHLATKSKKVMVADFIINGNWNELKLGQELPSSIVNDILQIQIYKGHDKIIWTAEPNGKFACKSASRMLRNAKPSTLTAYSIWHPKIPFKVAFFMMKLMRGRIATDDKVRKFKVHGPSACNCCKTHHEENIQHLFVDG